jgi:hypothetical protein
MYYDKGRNRVLCGHRAKAVTLTAVKKDFKKEVTFELNLGEHEEITSKEKL